MGRHVGDVESQALMSLEDEEFATFGPDCTRLVRALHCTRHVSICRKKRNATLVIEVYMSLRHNSWQVGALRPVSCFSFIGTSPLEAHWDELVISMRNPF